MKPTRLADQNRAKRWEGWMEAYKATDDKHSGTYRAERLAFSFIRTFWWTSGWMSLWPRRLERGNIGANWLDHRTASAVRLYPLLFG